MSITKIYVDVSSAGGESGPFAWAMCVEKDGFNIENSGVEVQGTRNATEIKALTRALLTLDPVSNVRLYTDSPYLRNNAGARVSDWKARGWKTSRNKIVANQAEWEAFLSAMKGHFLDKAKAAEVRQSTLYLEIETIARLALQEWLEGNQNAA